MTVAFSEDSPHLLTYLYTASVQQLEKQNDFVIIKWLFDISWRKIIDMIQE